VPLIVSVSVNCFRIPSCDQRIGRRIEVTLVDPEVGGNLEIDYGGKLAVGARRERVRAFREQAQRGVVRIGPTGRAEGGKIIIGPVVVFIDAHGRA